MCPRFKWKSGAGFGDGLLWLLGVELLRLHALLLRLRWLRPLGLW